MWDSLNSDQKEVRKDLIYNSSFVVPSNKDSGVQMFVFLRFLFAPCLNVLYHLKNPPFAFKSLPDGII